MMRGEVRRDVGAVVYARGGNVFGMKYEVSSSISPSLSLCPSDPVGLNVKLSPGNMTGDSDMEVEERGVIVFAVLETVGWSLVAVPLSA
jgi:hypothetical protein